MKKSTKIGIMNHQNAKLPTPKPLKEPRFKRTSRNQNTERKYIPKIQIMR